jgi:broad specificity phosphatase PhoE
LTICVPVRVGESFEVLGQRVNAALERLVREELGYEGEPDDNVAVA